MSGRDMYYWTGGAVAALAADSAGSLPLAFGVAAGVGVVWALGGVAWAVATAFVGGLAEGMAAGKRGDS